VVSHLVSKFTVFKELETYRVRLNTGQVTSSTGQVSGRVRQMAVGSRSAHSLTWLKLFVVALSLTIVSDTFSSTLFTDHTIQICIISSTDGVVK
jgi:hypothetical protein